MHSKVRKFPTLLVLRFAHLLVLAFEIKARDLTMYFYSRSAFDLIYEIPPKARFLPSRLLTGVCYNRLLASNKYFKDVAKSSNSTGKNSAESVLHYRTISLPPLVHS